jgi:plasmid stabilization system protein ParE
MLVTGRILSYLSVRSAMIGIADGIEVMRVLHGRRDIQQAYFDF